MKIKNELIRIAPLFAALCALLIAVPVRIYQCLKIIDAKTGFYNEIDASVYVLYIVLAIGALAGFIIPFIRHKSLKPVSLCGKSLGFTIVSLVMALLLIIDSASQLMEYFDIFSEAASVSAFNVKEYVSAQGGTLLLLQAVSGAFAAIYFFVTGVTIGIGNADSSKYKILALVPTLWCIFRLLYRFKRTISFVNVSDLLLELFFIVFSMMFFFALAQVNSRVDINDKGAEMLSSVYWKVFGYGIPASLFALICFLPRFILLITGNSGNINVHYPVNFSDFGFALFTIYTCISAIRAEGNSSVE